MSEGSLAGGLILFSGVEGLVFGLVMGALFIVVCARSGVSGGVGCNNRVVTGLISGVMAVDLAAAALGGDITWSEKVNFVCLTAFDAVSLAGVTLVCLVFAPRLGEDLLPLAPLGLRRFEFLVMVGCCRSVGTRSCVGFVAVVCRCYVGCLLVCRFVLVAFFGFLEL